MNIFRIAFIFSFVICAQAVIANPIISLNATGAPPLTTDDQKGFIDEVAAEAFRRIGIELKTVRFPPERGLKSSNKGLIDGELVRVKGLDKIYTNLIRVPEKVMDWEFVAFSAQNISLENGWSDLSGKLVAHINGWKILENNIPASAEITVTENSDELFSLLKKGRTDFIVYERWAGQLRLMNAKMDNINELRPPLAVKEMFIYLHKKHKALVPKLASALVSMKEDGYYQTLVMKYLAPLVKK